MNNAIYKQLTAKLDEMQDTKRIGSLIEFTAFRKTVDKCAIDTICHRRKITTLEEQLRMANLKLKGYTS